MTVAAAAAAAAGDTDTAGPAPKRLDIGLAAAATSLDPYVHSYAPNLTVARHLFDSLVTLSEGLALEPALAVRWWRPNETTWRFELREGVRFHDGQPLTSRDVAASLRRPAHLRGSLYSLASSLEVITGLDIIDPLTLDLHTNGPAPALPRRLANLAIIPERLENVDSAAFSDPRIVAGTGPFRLVGGDPAHHLDLIANDDYWGGRPPWDRVVLHVLTDDARRVAALVDGTVDLIENVPPADATRLMTNPNLRVVGRPSTRVIYLGLDVGRATSPFIAGPDGGPIANPLRLPAVRQALSLAIDRATLLADVLQGQGATANQLLAPDVTGHAPDLPPLAYDLAAARGLMAKAGLAGGFAITLHCPRDRYVADTQIAESLARRLSRLNIQATVACLPAPTFFQRASAGDFSLYLAGLGVPEGDGEESLRSLLASSAFPGGAGGLNRGGWGTAEIDALLLEAQATGDLRHREAILQRVTRAAMQDLAIIPLYIQQSIWATHRRVEYGARTDELTLAQFARPAFP
jgi:peptide/nickel transport system substrate-binding protein